MEKVNSGRESEAQSKVLQLNVTGIGGKSQLQNVNQSKNKPISSGALNSSAELSDTKTM